MDTVVIRPGAGLSRESFEDDPRFTIVGPFSEGHLIVRLNHDRELRYTPPPNENDGELLELDAETWRVHGSAPGAERARDRDETTRWSSSDEMQQEHYFYAIRFAELTAPRCISMEIDLTQPFPTQFQVLGLTKKGVWIDIPFDREGLSERILLSTPLRPTNGQHPHRPRGLSQGPRNPDSDYRDRSLRDAVDHVGNSGLRLAPELICQTLKHATVA